MATVKDEKHIAKGQPTKQLFIETLVLDVDLTASIVDLIDNSIDGARRVRPNGDYSGLTVAITITPDRFEVRDNCGGIPLKIAQEYAFRFGRDATTHEGSVKHSVGHFGVGMKRTLFKIARHFRVESKSTKDSFTLDLSVDAWKRNSSWDFPLIDVTSGKKYKPDDTGTRIIVDKLRDDVVLQFSITTFVNAVRERIRLAHSIAISKGINITFNGETLAPAKFTVRQSAFIKPILLEGEYKIDKRSVSYRLIAGVGERNTDVGGWYVFCNDRLLLAAEQTGVTGWGDAPAQKYHQQFNHFRGYLFLDSDDPGLLPWNTTKTGVAEDSEVYKRVKVAMRDAISSVTSYLNALRKEEVSTEEDGDTPLLDAYEKAKPVVVTEKQNLRTSQSRFVWPKESVLIQRKAHGKRIIIKLTSEQFSELCESLDVYTPNEVGEALYAYYAEQEMGA